MNHELIIDGHGNIEQVPLSSHTIISKPKHQIGTTFSEYIGKAKEASKAMRERSLWKDTIDIDIQTDREWFALQPWGDFHIGSHGCDYDKLEEILAGPLEHDNLKTILLGNLGDFFTPMGGPKDGIQGEVMNVQTQLFAVKKFLTEYQDSILASVNVPDHEDWIYRSSGIDLYEFIAHELDIPLVTAGGSVKLHINKVTYDIMPFHKIAKFKSDFNLTHAGKQALRMHRDADIVLSGHIHKPDYEWATHNGHDVSLIQIGTLETKEIGSMYGKKEGFLSPVRSVYPIVLLNSETKDMQIVTDLKHAKRFLE